MAYSSINEYEDRGTNNIVGLYYDIILMCVLFWDMCIKLFNVVINLL